MCKESRSQIDRYAEMMADGFKNDPGLQFQLAAHEKAAEIFRIQCRGEIEAFYKLGLLRAENDAGFLLGFTTEESQSEEFAGALTEASQHVLQAVTQDELVAVQLSTMELAAISKPDWYLKYLGDAPVYNLQVIVVAPQHRGTGVFRRLMTPVLRRCDGEGRTIVLQTHNPDNVPKYEHLGFELTESAHSDKIGVTCYNMLRKPCNGN